ncbi:MAG: 3-hydroxyacyl-CoA dehydrogenase NAD-binding domain-containing protein [Desulfuromonadaceae bacterium]|nr:3-hydroxyacyl-CoA dehydrogenase NAD-binding domain-containing protein [Desulfuromonadaceae bacterium]
MSLVRYETNDDIAVVTIDSPPVNCLNHGVRSGLIDALDQADMDPSIRAVVLIGSGNAFCAGADISELGLPLSFEEPTFHGTVLGTLDAMSKPVVAAINGVALGGGLELALGCNYRIAAPGTKFGLPEVKLGFMPGGGGTQRLPRAIGLEHALNMVLSGDPVRAEDYAGTELVREIANDDLRTAATKFARNIAADRPLPRLRDLRVEHPHASALLQFARGIVKSNRSALPGAMPIIDAIESAVNKTFDQGMQIELALFTALSESTEAKALCHAFFAERNSEKIDNLPVGTIPRAINTAAVIGAGTMGGGIAMCFADAGIPVKILDVKQEALDRGLAQIKSNYEASLKRGKLSEEQFAQRLNLIQSTLSYQEIGDADIVVEAVFEEISVKEKVFTQLDTMMKAGAILATNTSSLDVNRIASFTKRPQDVIGTHFFSPANIMRLLEVVSGTKTASDVLAGVMKLAKTLRKTTVVAGVCDGFIGNRMLEEYLRQALFLLDEGALPWQIDKVLEKFGMAMGPFRMLDVVGNDVPWAVRKRHYIKHPEKIYSKVADKLCEQGWFGQKTGRGWYRYEPGVRVPQTDPEVARLIEVHSASLGLVRRKISDEEIVGRCIYAMINEGAALLEEGIAKRASDIDVVYLSGYGFPARRGGPMFYADTVGLGNVLRTMRRYARNPYGDVRFWEPVVLLARLAAEGKNFTK